jgi:hypothetical protein
MRRGQVFNISAGVLSRRSLLSQDVILLVYAKEVFDAGACVKHSVHVRFRTLLFPARQVNGTRPVSPGPGNPALRQENVATRYLVSAVWLLGDGKAHLPVRLALR